MALFGCKDEDEALLMKSADLIYRVMEMIYGNRDKDYLEDDELNEWFSNQQYPESEYIQVGIENGWLRKTSGGIEITPYGKEYEAEYWKTFR
jgi:hypothetical protein